MVKISSGFVSAWFASTLPRHLAFFEKALAESGTGWLVGSRAPTAADFLVGCQLRAFEKTCADKVTMPAALAAYTERLFALPAYTTISGRTGVSATEGQSAKVLLSLMRARFLAGV